jgi:plastocyanin
VLAALASALVLLAAVLVQLAAPAAAASRTVTLTGNGPSPAGIAINSGDRVVFVNSDSVSHTVTDTSGSWSFRATIRPGTSATGPVLTSAGSYGYNDAFFSGIVQRNVDGTITVRAASPSATPKPTPKPTASSPRPTSKPSPTPTRSASPSASPSRSATASPSPSVSPSPTATAGLGLPVVTLPPTAGPTPTLAPPVTASPESVAYGPTSEIAQASAHRYGLPVLLALLAAGGVLSLLIRFLLAQPEGAAPASRRTGP